MTETTSDTKERYTPGPWTWEPTWGEKELESFSALKSGELVNMGTEETPCWEVDGENILSSCDGCRVILDGPDARLIAAAPDLLDLVKRALDGDDPRKWNPDARAAIAKAEDGDA